MCTRLLLPASVRTELERLSCAGAPNEACGVLIGTRSDRETRVVDATSSRNLETERPHERFTLDPVHLMTAETDARARGLEVVGIWHSHPERPALPSEEDRVAAWEGWSYVIVSAAEGCPPELRSWRLDGDALAEETITTDSARR